MYRAIKGIAQELGLRGWRFEIENDDRFYLSKFDEGDDNDDEFRFYFFIKNDTIQIVRRIKIMSYKYKESVDIDHPFYEDAKKILDTYLNKHVKVAV